MPPEIVHVPGVETMAPESVQGVVSSREKPVPDIATKVPTNPDVGLIVIVAAAKTGVFTNGDEMSNADRIMSRVTASLVRRMRLNLSTHL